MEDNFVLNQDAMNKAFKSLEDNGRIGKSKRLPEDGDYIFGEKAEEKFRDLAGKIKIMLNKVKELEEED